MSTELESYSNELLLALRLRDVPGTRIAEALAEVQSHVSETGEEAIEAFGSAREYADELAVALGASGTPAWRAVLSWSTARSALGGFLGAQLLLSGVLGLLMGGGPGSASPPPWPWCWGSASWASPSLASPRSPARTTARSSTRGPGRTSPLRCPAGFWALRS